MRTAALFALTLLSSGAMAVDMRAFVRGSWQEICAANAGQPTVMHIWGLTCAPCLTELPQWAALRKERPDLNIIMLATDPLSASAADLTGVLQKAGLASGESWAFADAFTERLRFEIDPKWLGEMPRTILLARDGSITAMPGLADLGAVRSWYDAETANNSRR